MSYDTSIRIDTGAESLADVEECGNMTSNIGNMYRAAMPGPYERGGLYDAEPKHGTERQGGLPGISGLPCPEASAIIAQGLEYMRAHEAEMRAMEPDNGWGSYDGALRYLEQIKAACDRHPKAVLGVNW